MYKTIMAKNDVIKKSEKVRRIPSVNMPMVILLAKSVTCGKTSWTSVAKGMKTSCAPESV